MGDVRLCVQDWAAMKEKMGTLTEVLIQEDSDRNPLKYKKNMNF